jgi:uncharacterized membrane protein
MKYICTIEINLPIDKTVALWSNENNFKEWQDGFQSISHLSGTPNTKGAKAKIILQDKRKIELLETIISVDLPKKKIALYEHIHMTNTQTSCFKTIDNNRTLYTSEVEYTQFNGFLIKLIAKLFPGKFKEQSQKWMDQFKAFAENSV